jgi:branched-chain amino acid transport system permease protein
MPGHRGKPCHRHPFLAGAHCGVPVFMGAAFGAFVGLPALRLKHLYLAIATLSFQMIFEWFIQFMSFFNQGQTIYVGRAYWFTGEIGRNDHYQFWYYIILTIVVVLGFGVRNLLKTKYGRCLVAVQRQ